MDDEGPVERLPSLTLAQRRELEAARDAWLVANRHANELAERLCPYKIGDRIQTDLTGETIMEVATMQVAGGGIIRLSGKEVNKTGKLGKREVSRHLNLFHLPVEEEPHG